MRSPRYIQPQPLSEKEEARFLEQVEDEEGEEAPDEAVEEGKMEFEPLSGRCWC